MIIDPTTEECYLCGDFPGDRCEFCGADLTPPTDRVNPDPIRALELRVAALEGRIAALNAHLLTILKG